MKLRCSMKKKRERERERQRQDFPTERAALDTRSSAFTPETSLIALIRGPSLVYVRPFAARVPANKAIYYTLFSQESPLALQRDSIFVLDSDGIRVLVC